MNNERIHADGMAGLERGEFEQGLKTAERLIEAGYSGGFELKALAQAGLGQKPAAIASLRQGVRAAPSVWLLWNLLGNYLSDEGQYAAACEAFRHALDCPQVDESCVRYNYSVALARWGKPLEGVKQIENINEGEYARPAAVQKLALLVDLGRHDEAVALGKRLLAESSRTPDSLVSLICARLAQSSWRWKKDQPVAHLYALKAIELDEASEFALTVLREIDNQRSLQSVNFTGLIEFDFDHFGYPGTAVRSFRAVADDEAELTEFLRRLEPPQRRESVHLHKIIREEVCPNELKGVCWRSVIVTCSEPKRG